MSAHFKNPLVWLHSLISAFIGGGATAVVSGFSAMVIAPDKFDMHTNLSNTLKMAGATFLIAGVMNAAAKLSKSPLPEIEETTENKTP